jgi:hypothetical protein
MLSFGELMLTIKLFRVVETEWAVLKDLLSFNGITVYLMVIDLNLNNLIVF